MKTTKLYVSGKITGDSNYFQKFTFVWKKLTDAGYRGVEIPPLYATAEMDWAEAMRKVLAVMLTCDGVALLPDWIESKGAKIEACLAAEIGLAVKPIEEWLNE
jgi:hypothetical protein